jgi:hypothetical protein
MNGAAVLPQLLVVEPDFLLRRTVAGVVREMRLAQVHEATTVEHAARDIAAAPFLNALLISLDAEGAALQLLGQLHDGGRIAALSVAVTAETCDAGLALRLRELDVRRVLLKPFRVKGIVETIAGLVKPH